MCGGNEAMVIRVAPGKLLPEAWQEAQVPETLAWLMVQVAKEDAAELWQSPHWAPGAMTICPATWPKAVTPWQVVQGAVGAGPEGATPVWGLGALLAFTTAKPPMAVLVWQEPQSSPPVATWPGGWFVTPG